jgi:hypothetical protein
MVFYTCDRQATYFGRAIHTGSSLFRWFDRCLLHMGKMEGLEYSASSLRRFFLASIWMTLCGPATEAHTYFIMAPALVIASVKSFHDRQPLSLRMLASGAFLLQIVPPARVSYLIHTKQEWVFISQSLSALLLLAYCLFWLLNDSFWTPRNTEIRNKKSECEAMQSER